VVASLELAGHVEVLPHAKDWAEQGIINPQYATLSSKTHGARAHASNDNQISPYLLCSVSDRSDDPAWRSKELYGAPE
jgi:hypothetical protein